MVEQLQIKRLSAGTLARIYFVGYACTLYPIAIVAGIPAAFGANTVSSHGVQVHGWQAILDMLAAPPIFALFSALFSLALTWPGLWLFSRFAKTPIRFYVDASDPAVPQRGRAGSFPRNRDNVFRP